MKFCYAVLLALVLAGCGKDPVVADLEAFDQLGRSVFQDSALESVKAKISQAKTSTEKAALLGEIAQTMEAKQKALSAFKANTPETLKIVAAFNAGLQQSVEGAKNAQTALLAADQAELSKASVQMNDAQKTLREAASDFTKLAKEKGVKLNR